MRINVYAEELTKETQVVSKVVSEGPNKGRTFYGVRMFLASPDVLHADPNDDDRSAITFWVPWTKERGHDFEHVSMVLDGLDASLTAAYAMEHDLHPDEVPPAWDNGGT